MRDRVIHRLSRGLRLIMGMSVMLQGIFVPGRTSLARAAASDTMRIGMTPGSFKPPDAATGMLASANPSVEGLISLTWSSPQGVAGGTPIANQTVANYIVEYATFSVDDLAGDTTAWWNASATSRATLQPPGYIPQSPGQLESFSFSNLIPGDTYYFGLKSTGQLGTVSSIDVQSATPGQQANAIATAFIDPPPSLTGVVLSSTSIEWDWPLVAGATGYVVYSKPTNTPLQRLPAGATFWIETDLNANTLYTRAVHAFNALTQSLDSPLAGAYTFAVAPAALEVTSVTDSLVQLSWTGDGNPASTVYGYERSLDGATFTQVAQVTALTGADSGLAAGTTYYYRVQAFNGANVPTAYSTTVSTQTAPSLVAPAMPNGLIPSLRANQFSLGWTPVGFATTGVPVTIDHYRIDRYDAIGGTLTGSFNVAGGAALYQETTTTVSFYRVTAVSTGGGISPPSDYVDSSEAANRYFIAADDVNTRVVVPAALSRGLLAADNDEHEDLEIRVLRRSQDEVNTTLRSYQTEVYRPSTGETVPNFVFPQTMLSVQLGYGSAISNGQIPTYGSSPAHSTSQSDAQALLQVVSVFWLNGGNYVRISDPVLTSNQALSVTVRNLGVYQLRAVIIGSAFKLMDGSPYPRIITPNDPAHNNRVFFFFDNPTDSTVSGSIYDIRGAKVTDFGYSSLSPASNAIVWNGRDSRGAVVPTGVYLYKITCGSTVLTGTVVVAR